MIETINLVKTYKPKKGIPVKALDEISLKLPNKGMVVILGKSGSGKSTLLNVLGGLDTFSSGDILVKGVSTKNFKQSDFDSYRNTFVGFIFQEYNILDEFSVGANIALAMELQGKKPTSEEINDILGQVDLLKEANRKPNELSGGQKQRVAIARALIKKPDIIMADEPTGALDSVTGKQVFDTLKNLSKSKLILVVSHDREFAEQYADRIIELADGKIISDVEKEIIENEKEKESLNFENDEILIPCGYELTNEDIVKINNYIKNLKANSHFKIDNNKHFNYTFVPTKSQIEDKKEEKLDLIKSKLSFKHAFKIGASGLKHKKFRLIVTIFLSFIAFTLFGLADTIASYNKINTCVNSIYGTPEINYASFSKEVYKDYGDYGYFNETNLTQSDIDYIKEKTNLNFKGVFFSPFNFSDQVKTKKENSLLSNLFTSTISGFTEMSSVEDLNKYGYTLLAGNLPTAINEIALPKYFYDYLSYDGISFSYKKADNSIETIKINNYNDLLGKTLNGESYLKESYSPSSKLAYKITGIVDTHFDLTRYQNLIDETYLNDKNNAIWKMILTQELKYYQNFSLNTVGFVTNDFIDNLVATQTTGFEEIDINKTTLSIDNNVVDIGYISNIEKLPNKYLFFDESKTKLENNEILVSIETALNLMKNNRTNYDKLFEKNVLTENELAVCQNPNFEKITTLEQYFLNINEISFNLYINNEENFEDLKTYLVEIFNLDQTFINTKSYSEIKTMIFNNENNVNNLIMFEPFRNYQKSYIEYLVEKYSLQNSIMSIYDFENYNKTISFDYEYFYDKNTYNLIDFVYNDVFNGNPVLIFNFEQPLDLADYLSDYTNLFENIEIIMQNYKSSVFDKLDQTSKVSQTFEDVKKYYLYLMNVENIPNYQDVSILKTKIFLSMFSNFDIKNTIKLNAINIYKEKICDNLVVNVVGMFNSTGLFFWNNDLVISKENFEKIVQNNESGIYSHCVASMPTTKDAIKNLVEFSYLTENNKTYPLINSVTFQLNQIDGILETMKMVFLYVGIGFALFASLMLTNFIGTSVAYKKRDIGILRAIGSRSKDVFMIFFAESFIIAMINFVLSFAGTLTLSIIINGILKTDVGLYVEILTFGFRQTFMIMLISVFCAFIATFLPVWKIARKRPIDAIKNR